MKIQGKNKTVEIPNLLVFVGLLVADNIAANICRVKLFNKQPNGKS